MEYVRPNRTPPLQRNAMETTRVFYDDIYIYQEFSQPIEGQVKPVAFKIAVGPKPEYASLAAVIEETYANAYGKPSAEDASETDDPSAAPRPSPELPAEYYAEHILYVSRLGTVWHIEYHFHPEPEVWILPEPGKAERREKGFFTRAILYDQVYRVGDREYIVTSLRGNYADFPGYSPFLLEKAQGRMRRLGREQLLASGARFENADRGRGIRFNADEWFLKQFVPRLLLGIFEKN